MKEEEGKLSSGGEILREFGQGKGKREGGGTNSSVERVVFRVEVDKLRGQGLGRLLKLGRIER